MDNMILATTLMLLCYVTSLKAYDCTQADQCQETVRIEMVKAEAGGLSRASELEMCSDVREAMDCLVWIATSCGKVESDRQRLGVSVMKARRFLSSECEDEDGVEENWMDSSCYRSASDQCNAKFQSSNLETSAKEERCRVYDNYRNCIDGLLTEKCTQKERIYFSSFLLDNARELTYMCSTGVPTVARYQSLPVPEAWSASELFDSVRNWIKAFPCLKQLQDPVEKCVNTYKEEQEKSTKEIPGADIQRKQCCLFRELEHCVEVVIKDTCGDDTHKAIKQVVKPYEKRLPVDCEQYQYGSPECSSAISIRPFISILVLLVITIVLF